MHQEIPKCEIQTPKSDTLQRPSRQIRDDALQMLEMLSVREWADDGMEGKPRNISSVSDFLIAKGVEDCDSNASAEISGGAFATYFSVAKRVGLYLAARICVQRTIDHLVYQLAQLMLEDNMEPLRPSANRYGNGNFVLEFSPGRAINGSTESNRKSAKSPCLLRKKGCTGRLEHMLLMQKNFNQHCKHLLALSCHFSSEDIVVEHCQHRLVNLLCPLLRVTWNVCDVEISDGENKQQVVSLIKYVQSKRGSMMWEEDTTVVRTELPSAALLSALVQSMVDDTFFQGDLRETWGAKALNGLWNAQRHLARRSQQIHRALRPRVTNDACIARLMMLVYPCYDAFRDI
ncbi:hypothetical protein CQW23_05481 [Capsicum baccatum]|uniref:Cell morphogenesis central region domain-containing protein n=1 Tax=Capsicum baccatum TaxID=33114 RepID=A0A2G2XHN2_CAPBA|nr:hypothetical protein CQW23_05481 [Capsicum baccatum]